IEMLLCHGRLRCQERLQGEEQATPPSTRPRLGGISFLHRFGSALNHHVHFHACVTDGVFVPAAAEAGTDAPPTFLPARPINQADLAALTERVRRRVIRRFRMQRLLDAAAAADMFAWENSGFSVDASVRITLIDRDVPSYFQSLEHLLRYCARPPFALERLSVIRDADGRIARIRYVLPRHKAATWVGPGRDRKSTRPGANGVVELSPFEFLDRLADLVPPPRKHRHRYHGVFAPNHRLRKAVTALAIGNIGKQRDAASGGHATGGHVSGGCCAANHATLRPRSHDTSRIAWAKLLARVREEFPLECPSCGGDIRLIAFITEPGPIRKILTHLGEPLEPPPVSPARGPPTDWGELVQAHDDRDVFQSSPDELPAIDIHSLSSVPDVRSNQGPGGRTRRASAPTAEKRHCRGRTAVPGAGDLASANAAPASPAAHRLGNAYRHRCGSAIGRTIPRAHFACRYGSAARFSFACLRSRLRFVVIR
ncbi:hypothetical protein EBR04_07540, partial [bacterium]|nr:hypothetical protein [bacterium]